MENNLNLYIAFEEVDNSASGYEQRTGWVDVFCEHLKMALERLIGYAPEIIPATDFDPSRKKNGDYYALLTILSEKSCKAPKLNAEINRFYKAFDANSWIVNGIAAQAKIFKILKEPVLPEAQPEPLRDLLSIEFYYHELETGRIVPFSPSQQNSMRKRYWIKVSDIAYHIFELLEGKSLSAGDKKSEVVYLADGGVDLVMQRQIIKRELRRQGYTVLPNKIYPNDPKQAKARVEEEMRKCRLSIHLIGGYYGAFLSSQLSAAEMQHNIASSIQDPSFKRIIWASPDIEFSDERQKIFFENVKRESEGKENVEFIQCTVEDLKSYIHQKLTDTEVAPREQPVQSGESQPVLYFIYDQCDRKKGKKIADAFSRFGFKLIQPRFDVSFREMREMQIENFGQFDAAIIFCEQCNEKWLHMKLMDLMKAPAFGREKPLFAKLLISKKATVDLSRIKNFEIDAGYMEADQDVDYAFAEQFLMDIDTLKMIKTY